MQKQLQAASEAIERLLEPASLVQLAVIVARLVLGWWIARRVRRDLGAAETHRPAGAVAHARPPGWPLPTR